MGVPIDFNRYVIGKDAIGLCVADPCYEYLVEHMYQNVNIDLSGWMLDIATTSNQDLYIRISRDATTANFVTVEKESGGIVIGAPYSWSLEGYDIGMDSATMLIGTAVLDAEEFSPGADGLFGHIDVLYYPGDPEPCAFVIDGWFSEYDSAERIEDIIAYNFNAYPE